MIVTQRVESDPRSSAREREKLRFAITRDWRSAGRWDFSECEMAAEIETRFADLRGRRATSQQLQLPLEANPGQISRETRSEALQAISGQSDKLLDRIRGLLELAGRNGMTRNEIASRVGKFPSSVSAPVKTLIETGEACEPSKRVGESGHSQAVVVLAKFAGRPAT